VQLSYHADAARGAVELDTALLMLRSKPRRSGDENPRPIKVITVIGVHGAYQDQQTITPKAICALAIPP
jgi:hypothetical protein